MKYVIALLLVTALFAVPALAVDSTCSVRCYFGKEGVVHWAKVDHQTGEKVDFAMPGVKSFYWMDGELYFVHHNGEHWHVTPTCCGPTNNRFIEQTRLVPVRCVHGRIHWVPAKPATIMAASH